MDRDLPESTDGIGGRARDPFRADHCALVEGACAWCGLVTVAIDQFGCTPSQADGAGLCQFVCPVCSRLNTRGVGLLEIKTLIVAGARFVPTAPLELLEARTGGALTWDEVLDFSLALNTSPRRPATTGSADRPIPAGSAIAGVRQFPRSTSFIFPPELRPNRRRKRSENP